MVSLNLLLDRKRSRKDGSCQLKIGVAKDQENRYIYLKVYVRPEDWDAQNSFILPSCMLFKQYNMIVSNSMFKAEQTVANLYLRKGEKATLDDYLDEIYFAVFGRRRGNINKNDNISKKFF